MSKSLVCAARSIRESPPRRTGPGVQLARCPARSLRRLCRRLAEDVNTGRGTLIDEEALIEALTESRLGGAGLDVVRDEPLATDSPLRSAPNLILTDHVAWYSESSVRELQRQVGLQARAILDGKVPANWVNPW